MNIPSMCKQPLIGNLLAARAARVKPGQVVVEVGVWFGACTYAMARAVQPGVIIHAYDNFVLSQREVDKLKKRGYDYQKGDDVLSVVQGYMVDLPVILHQGQWSEIPWSGKEIGLLIMDGAKGAGAFNKVIESLEPYFAKNMMAIFMDYWYPPLNGYQENYIESSGKWSFIGSLRGSDEAEFTYNEY